MTYQIERAVKASTFARAAKRVEKQEVEARGRSLTAASFSCNSCLMRHGARIEEIQGDILYISGDWRKALREGARMDTPNSEQAEKNEEGDKR